MIDNIPAEIGIPVALVLWAMVLVMYLRDRRKK